jgi:hypothetical protein
MARFVATLTPPSERLYDFEAEFAGVITKIESARRKRPGRDSLQAA